jgi:fibronectin-binding autotransporter adhesin
LINAGTLALSGSGSISSSTNIVIAAGSELNVSARSDTMLTLASGQTLQGNGVVNGLLTVSPGAILSAGTSWNSIGMLTVSNNVTLQGVTYLKINAAAATNDVLVSAGSFVLGGTVTVTNLSGALTAGQTFTFLAGTALSGAFSVANLPPLSAGLGWSNNLAVNGSLTVVTVTPPPQPHVTGVSLSSGSLVMTGTNGSPGQSFSVLSTTNLATPLSQWTLAATNTFGGANFSITNPVNPTAPQNYFILRVP